MRQLEFSLRQEINQSGRSLPALSLALKQRWLSMVTLKCKETGEEKTILFGLTPNRLLLI